MLLGIMGGLAWARPSGTRAVDEAGRGPRPDPGWPLSRGGRGILRTQEECPGHSQRRGQLLASRKTNQLHRTNSGLGPAASPAPSQPLAVRFPPGSSHGDPGPPTRPFGLLRGGRPRGGAGDCSEVSPGRWPSPSCGCAGGARCACARACITEVHARSVTEGHLPFHLPSRLLHVSSATQEQSQTRTFWGRRCVTPVTPGTAREKRHILLVIKGAKTANGA